jgi:hypothetical protein
MKEIDFLPQWYRDKRRSQSRYRTQYVGIACLVLVMAAWTVSTINTMSAARATLNATRTATTATGGNSEYQSMKADFDQLHKHTALLSTIDQHLKISGLLGEFSLLAGESVKLSRLSIASEKLRQKDSANQLPSNTIRAVRDVMTDKSGPYQGNIRYKVTIVGIAADGTCVAGLIGRLEGSPWFSQVTPSYCKNGVVDGHTVSEFEITCYINNYTESRRTMTAAAGGEDKGGI